MLRPVFVACALIASATCAARPMVIHPSQTLEPPAGSGDHYFGIGVAIDGDWAIVTAGPTPSNPLPTWDALLYHRVNGQWTLDRPLVRREAGFHSVAMNNGVAAIGSNPTRIFKRTNNTWTEIAHPFTVPPGDPNWVSGDLVWDGNTLLAERPGCPWGALISRLNVDGSWSPIERLSSDDTQCSRTPNQWAISGNTVVAGTYTNDLWGNSDVAVPDQLMIFRRSGTTWMQTAAIDEGNGQGDVRGNEIFFASYGAGGTLVYRNDDTLTVVDNIRTVSTSTQFGGPSYGFHHTNDLFVQNGSALFRKNAAGKYEHVAVLVPNIYDAAVSGLRVFSKSEGASANEVVLTFDLPETFTPSPVIATGFESGPSPFTPQLGTFAVATTSTGNHVYRQSSLAGDYRALLGGSDWTSQSIEADIKPTAFSGSNRWAGLAVHYLDAANYYYVTLRSSGVVELKRMRNGVYETVARKELPIVPGRSYHVALQAFTPMIMVRVDGAEFIWWIDEQPIPHGSVALLGYRTAVEYDNVVAAQVGGPIVDLTGCDAARFWTTNGAGNWSCSGDTGVYIILQSSTAGDARAVLGTPTDDQVVTTRARATSFGSGQDRWFGIAARYADASNYYYLTVRNSNTVSLRKVVNGAITVLGTAPLPVRPNTWYNLRLDAVGNELRAFVNGTQVLQKIDASHASGQGGLLTYKTAAEYTAYSAWQP